MLRRAVAWRARHRLWSAAAGVTVVVAGGAVAAYVLVFLPSSTPVGVGQALRLYAQAGGGTNRPREPGLPAPGVYSYRTTGHEGLDIPGQSRTFPALTTMIVTDGRCDTVTWEPITEHVERFTECPAPGGGVSFTSSSSTEMIAGITTSAVIRCPPTTYLLPATGGPRTWHATCRSRGLTIAARGQDLGAARVDVGGRLVRAEHIRLVFGFSGAESGTNPSDYWLAPSTGTLLKEVETVNLGQGAGPLGKVHYDEAMSTTLTSLRPSLPRRTASG